MDKNITKSNNIDLEILSLYLSDYNLGLHGREISRLLKKNHRTVLLALKRLEDKRIMIYKEIGRSKQYMLNLKNITTKEYIKNAESFKMVSFIEKHFIIKKLLNEVQYNINLTPIIIFGSYAKGEEIKESDLDMLIIKNKNKKFILDKIHNFSKLYKVRIQIQELTEKQLEQGLKNKDHLVIECKDYHIIINNIEYFVNVFWRYFYEK